MFHRAPVIALGMTCAMLTLVIGYLVYLAASLDRESDAYAKANTEAHASIKDLERQLIEARTERDRLLAALTTERAKTGTFERQIGEISGTVGTLTKLVTTDPELLAKYSKVYFLNENYVPSELALIDTSHRSDPSRPLEIHTQVKPFLEGLIDDAADHGIELRIVSAYRSFGTQAALKNGYTVNYGTGANRFSADQGYSEHQLGTTVDFTTKELGSAFTGFGGTEAYPWLNNNAHRYGFILSYPKGNTHYIHEPWHWRFVGVELATRLHNEGKSFYELDQREIAGYLATLFD